MPVSNSKLALVATSAFVLFVSPAFSQTTTEKSTVSAPAPDPAAKADPDMAKGLNAPSEVAPKPIETLTPSEARKQYSATDAVKKVIKDEKLEVDPALRNGECPKETAPARGEGLRPWGLCRNGGGATR